MLGFLKRVVHRGEDLNDIRSHVLGDKYGEYESPEPFPQQQRPQTIKAQFALPEQQPYQQPYGQYENETLPEPGFESRYGESTPLSSFNEPSQLGRSADKANRDYDILDRLNLMESQIAAIRSMTETINERLKNIDAKLSARRY